MIWIIIVIIIVGFFIVRAINNNTTNSALIAHQQYLNSPEYINQEQATLEYLTYVEEVQRLNIMIIGSKISQAIDRAEHPIDKASLKNSTALIEHFENELKSLNDNFAINIKKYPNYKPNSIELSYRTYSNFMTEDGLTSYDLYKRDLNKVDELTVRLSEVTKEQYNPYDEALDIVRGKGDASPSLLQHRMNIGYTRAKKYIDQMEKDGLHQRKVSALKTIQRL